ncbi:MAG: 50S ribosomal protein L13 [Parcubacteria group bacterium]|nr:50S ribosomal protein L13 [Parcubacteria group bacterium]
MPVSKNKTYNIDAKGQSLGRLATNIATLLRGKSEINYAPHLDPLITVRVANIDKIVLTGKKAEQKIYRHYTGYPGGLREIKYQEFIKKDKGKALKMAVLRMLNKNRLRPKLMKRLIINPEQSRRIE